jgi:hypothetical protein
LGVVTLFAALAGCIHHGAEAAYPLYPGPRLGDDRVAFLLGPIATVDGAAVPANVPTFELLPRCHVVTTQTKLLAFDSNEGPQGSVVGTLSPIVYVIDMQAGHSYVIERQVQRLGGDSAHVATNARDVGPDGQSVDLVKAHSTAEIAACRSRW